MQMNLRAARASRRIVGRAKPVSENHHDVWLTERVSMNELKAALKAAYRRNRMFDAGVIQTAIGYRKQGKNAVAMALLDKAGIRMYSAVESTFPKFNSRLENRQYRVCHNISMESRGSERFKQDVFGKPKQSPPMKQQITEPSVMRGLVSGTTRAQGKTELGKYQAGITVR